MSMTDRSGGRHDAADSVLAITLGLPWSLLLGVLVHPDAKSGLAILMVSMGINVALLARLARLAPSGAGAGAERLGGFASLAGLAATTVWTILALLTATSLLASPEPDMPGLTLAVAAVFAGIAAVLHWRTCAVAALCRDTPPRPAKTSLYWSEIVTASTMLLLGVLLVTAVVSRVLGEGLPLFG
jgi:hypothetical protein